MKLLFLRMRYQTARQILTEINNVVQNGSTFSKQYEAGKQKSKAIQSSLLKF